MEQKSQESLHKESKTSKQDKSLIEIKYKKRLSSSVKKQKPKGILKQAKSKTNRRDECKSVRFRNFNDVKEIQSWKRESSCNITLDEKSDADYSWKKSENIECTQIQNPDKAASSKGVKSKESKHSLQFYIDNSKMAQHNENVSKHSKVSSVIDVKDIVEKYKKMSF